MHLSLLKLAATNFRAIRNEVSLDLEKLPPGLYFVAGRNEVEPRLGANGAGKSTLFVDLLHWVLTGKTARAQRPGADVENWDADTATTGMLEIAVDGEIRMVERGRRPNFLKLDGKPVSQDEIDGILPLTEAALRRTLVIDQFSQKFLDLRPEDKSRIFSETLNLDLWVKAANNASADFIATEKSLLKCQGDLHGVESAIDEVRDQRDEAEQREAEFEQNLAERLADLREQRKEAIKKVRDCDAALNTIHGAGDKASALTTHKTNLRHFRNEYTKFVSEENTLTTEIARLRGQLDRYAAAKTCPECGQPVTDKHQHKRQEELKKELGRVKREKVTVTAEVTSLADSIRKHETMVEKLEASVAQAGAVTERANAALAEFESVKQQIDDTKNQDNPFEKMFEGLDSRLKTLREQRVTLKESIEQMTQRAEVYKFWQRGFREIRLEQIDTTLMELEIAANHHAQTLGLSDWTIGFSTEREKTTGGISHAFTVLLYPPGQKDAISWDSYSGGESQRLTLAVTFGLAEVLLARGGISTDFEIVDEPTAHLSQDGIEDLLECLKDRATELNRRVFMIDHHSLSVGSFDGVFTCVKGKDGVRVEV